MSQDVWYFQKLGEEFGPLSLADLTLAIEHHTVTANDLVRAGTAEAWQRAASVESLRAHFPASEPAAEPLSASQPTAATAQHVARVPAKRGSLLSGIPELALVALGLSCLAQIFPDQAWRLLLRVDLVSWKLRLGLLAGSLALVVLSAWQFPTPRSARARHSR